jgi:VWFA-related protein
MRRAFVVIAAVVGSGLLSPSRPSAQAGSPHDGQSFTAATTAILVDVVVRDRKGRPVTDLTGADFEVAEDGVPQKVDTFARVARGGGIGVGVGWKSPEATVAVTPPGSAAPSAPDPEPPADATTALVFDHLSTESLRLAQKATLDYVPMNGESAVRVGVFATDPGVRMVQPFTTDRGLVRRAVARVVPSGTSAEEQKAERTEELMTRRRELQGQVEGAVGAAVGGGSAGLAQNASELGERENELRLIQTEVNMIRSFDNLDRDHQGYDTALALQAVVQSLSILPGRKTIVFFSEGLPVSPVLSARLDAVIDAANRANVTAYAVDAKGLRAKSTLTNTRKEMQGFVDERFMQIGSGTDRTEQPLTMAFERVEDTLKLDSRTGLARLAEETGGFLVEQSNDLRSAFRRIDEDNQFHYLLTYSPRNAAFDGKFRAIQVKVHRPATQVFARKGYRAVRNTRAVDSTGYELPALAMLERTPLPNAFPVHAAGFSFPDPGRPGLTPVLVHVDTTSLQYRLDSEHSTYSGQAAILVRIRDGQGHEVQKLSQQYVLSGEGKDLEAAKHGEILFYREAVLPPGVYTMETIVFDATAAQGSARVATLTVPEVDRTIGMSSLVLVNRIEEVRDAPTPEAGAIPPLYVGQRLMYPNLGEPFQKSGTAELPFYFTLYGDVQGAKAEAQLLQNGRPVAETPLQLPSASGSRVQHVGRLPISSLPAGTYELRIKVTDRDHEVSRTAYFTLKD